MFVIFFFFQAEDGIRDYKVTGVQTCALPISPARRSHHDELSSLRHGDDGDRGERRQDPGLQGWLRRGVGRRMRSEEGRGGEEGRSRWAPDHLKKKKKKIEKKNR